MSQKLADLVRPLVGDETAANFVEKYFSPSSFASPSRVPDSFYGRTTLIESSRNIKFSAPSQGDPNTPWALTVLSNPAAGAPAYVHTEFTDTTGAVVGFWAKVLEGDSLLQDAVDAHADNAASRYRIAAKSVTCNLDASALTNKGTVTAASIRNSWNKGGFTTTTDTVMDWRWVGAGTPDILSQGVLSTQPGSVVWQALDGMYMVARNDGRFEWARADPARLMGPFVIPTGQGTDPRSWHPCPDWTVEVCRFEGLDRGASVNVKFVTVYELDPELASVFKSFTEPSPTNLMAIGMIKQMSAQFGQFYPADFNDWGTLWQGVKSFFSKAKPLISKAARFIPGVGPVLSSVIDVIPTQTGEERQAAYNKQKERLNEEAQIRAAAIANANRVLQKAGKAPVVVKKNSNTVKAATSNARVACPYCSKGFSNKNQLKKHVATSPTCP